MSDPKPVECWLTDMDGVLVHEEHAIAGGPEFIEALRTHGRRFLVLTNNSIYTARDLRARLLRSGIDLPESAIWTSALATAQFLADQRAGGAAYVIGEAGLTSALHDVGFVLTERDPDYVVLGETRTYSFEAITRAIRLIERGARFIATNPDATGPSAEGSLPATGSVAALITQATGVRPYFVGKPNPLMMRSALNAIDAHSETTVMIGDRMDTDVIAGIEAGLRTILVLTGSTTPDQVERFPYRPTRVADSIADVVALVAQFAPKALREPAREAPGSPSERLRPTYRTSRSTLAPNRSSEPESGIGVGQASSDQPARGRPVRKVHWRGSYGAGPAARKLASGAATTGRRSSVPSPGSTTETSVVPRGSGGRLVTTLSLMPARCMAVGQVRRSVHRHSSATCPYRRVEISRTPISVPSPSRIRGPLAAIRL